MLTSSINLATSLVIVCHHTARIKNLQLTGTGHIIDDDNPDTWQYYRHLNGLQHPLDVTPQVRSIDTLEIIDFTKENLARHPNTKSLYSWGSRHTKKLVKNNMDYAVYIRSVVLGVNVANLSTLTQDTIIGWDKTLVESTEYDLIPIIQDSISRFMFRWHTVDYNLIDKGYLSGILVTLHSKIPIMISNARLKLARTEQAHSSHIKNYLDSNGLIGYWDYLNVKQRFWLYKNLPYLKSHIGTKKTLGILIDKLLNPNDIPLVGFELAYDNSELNETLKSFPYFEAKSLGSTKTSLIDRTVEELINSEVDCARGNADAAKQSILEANALSRSNVVNHLPTKVLESQYILPDTNSDFSLEETIVNQWVYSTLNGLYLGYHEIVDPHTGAVVYLSNEQLTPILFYCSARLSGVILDAVPTLTAKTIVPVNRTSFSVLFDKYVGDENLLDSATKIYSQLKAPLELTQPSKFFMYAKTLHSDMERLSSWIRLVGGINDRATLKLFFNRQFISYSHGDLGNYIDIFRTTNLYVDQWRDSDCYTFLNDMLPKVLGYKSSGFIDNAEKQNAILSIVEAFTSYTVQIISKASTSSSTSLETSPKMIDVTAHIAVKSIDIEVFYSGYEFDNRSFGSVNSYNERELSVVDASVSTITTGTPSTEVTVSSTQEMNIETVRPVSYYDTDPANLSDVMLVLSYTPDITIFKHIGDKIDWNYFK